MVFSSTFFLFYFLPGFLLMYYAVPARLKNAVALLASVGFYAWGAYYGLFLILDRLFLLRLYQPLEVLSIAPTFLITVVGWVLFRADTLAGAKHYLRAMFRLVPEATLPHLSPEFRFTLGMAAVAFAAAAPPVERWELRTLARSHFSWSGAAGFTLGTALATSGVVRLTRSFTSGFNFGAGSYLCPTVPFRHGSF